MTNSNTGAAGGIGSLAGSLPQISSLNNLSVQQLLAASQGNISTQQIFDSQSKFLPKIVLFTFYVVHSWFKRIVAWIARLLLPLR